MSDSINISMLLQKRWRTAEGIACVKEIANSLGISPSTIGRVTISGKIPLESFVKLFRVSPVLLEPGIKGNNHAGSYGGYMVETDLAIPAPLKEYVEAISVEPPAVRLRRNMNNHL